MSEITKIEDKQEDWLQKKWRPLMAGMYLVVCTCDFVIFPVLWGILQTLGGGRVETQWSPITLQGAGLFHMAMGAILGIAAWGRTQEKMAGAASNSPPSFSIPAAPAPSFGSTPLGGNSASTAPAFAPAPAPSFGSKPSGPGRIEQPEL
jgi:hypothetical protein